MSAMLSPTELESSPNPNGVAMSRLDDVFVLPTTVGQQGFWYLDQFQPGNTAYNIAVRFRLQGSLRADLLERALNDIVARHESLRTVFAVQDGVPVQVIAPALTILLPCEDLRVGGDNERRQRAKALASEEARRRFDLAKGPLLRTNLQSSGESHALYGDAGGFSAASQAIHRPE